MFVLCRRNFWREFEKRTDKNLYTEDKLSVYQVRNVTTKDNILQTAKNRNGQWGQDFQFWIETISDPVAAEVQYHHLCLTKFFTPVTPGEKSMHPFAADIVSAMENIYLHWMPWWMLVFLKRTHWSNNKRTDK